MRKSNSEPLKDILKQYLRAIGAERKMKEIKIKRNWEDIVGRAFASYTEDIYFKNEIFYIRMSSATAKNELMMIRSELVDRLNKEAGEILIKDIVIL